MRILVLCPFYPTRYSFWAGPWIHSQSRALLSLGHEVRVLRVNEHNRLEIKERKFLFKRFDQELDGVPVRTSYFPKVPKLEGLTKRIRFLLYRHEIDRLRKDWPIDLVFLHFSGSFEAQVALDLKRRLGVPYILLEHSSWFMEEGPTAQVEERSIPVFRQASAVMAVSPKLTEILRILYPVKVVDHPDVIDTEFFAPVPGPESGDITFITVGSLVQRKNFLSLVDAFAQAFQKIENVRLVICGDGEVRQELEDRISRHNLQKRIELTGKLDQEHIRDWLRRSSIYVFPSLSESFGVSAIEAMSCGLPVVSTRTAGPLEFIDESVGCFCDSTPESIATAMMKAMNKSWDRTAIRKKVVENYSIGSAARRMRAVLEMVPR